MVILLETVIGFVFGPCVELVGLHEFCKKIGRIGLILQCEKTQSKLYHNRINLFFFFFLLFFVTHISSFSLLILNANDMVFPLFHL